MKKILGRSQKEKKLEQKEKQIHLTMLKKMYYRHVTAGPIIYFYSD